MAPPWAHIFTQALSNQNSVEQESSAFVVSWSVLEAFVTNSVGLDRTVYIGSA